MLAEHGTPGQGQIGDIGTPAGVGCDLSLEWRIDEVHDRQPTGPVVPGDLMAQRRDLAGGHGGHEFAGQDDKLAGAAPEGGHPGAGVGLQPGAVRGEDSDQVPVRVLGDAVTTVGVPAGFQPGCRPEIPGPLVGVVRGDSVEDLAGNPGGNALPPVKRHLERRHLAGAGDAVTGPVVQPLAPVPAGRVVGVRIGPPVSVGLVAGRAAAERILPLRGAGEEPPGGRA